MGSKAGATIDDDMGEMNMKRELSMVIPQRLALLQFLGLAGSSGPSHVILDKVSNQLA
jgi:hypothetical protein